MRWRRAGSLVMAAVLSSIALGACSPDDEPAVSGATVPTAAPTTTTTNPYAVPAVIDAAYVNRVLAGLDAAVGDVFRMVVAARTIPREAYDRLRAMYGTDALLNRLLDELSRAVARQFTGYRADLGDVRSTVTQIISTSTSCIYVRVERDYTAVTATMPLTADRQWAAIRLADQARDPNNHNRIGWAFIYEGFERGFGPPASDPCAAA